MKIIEVPITNRDYFFAVENIIRDIHEGWAAYEANVLLPVCLEILKDSEVDYDQLKQYPVEGYYYKTKELTKYFQIIRNMQVNLDIIPKIKINTDSFKIILNVCSCPLFGPEVESDLFADLTCKAENGLVVPRTATVERILPRRKDILSRCLGDDSLWKHSEKERPYSIKKIWEVVGNYKYGFPNLVELGYLTGDLVCLACSTETNILYREMFGFSGCSGYRGPTCQQTILYVPRWEVSPDVEAMGASLLGEYNKLMTAYNPKLNTFCGDTLVIPTKELILCLNCRAEGPRITRLAYNKLTGINYSWIITSDEVKDFYSYRVIGTIDIKGPDGWKLYDSLITGAYKDTLADCNGAEASLRLGETNPNRKCNENDTDS